ncbi:Gfo/Idh/MocA family protein [Alienimonas chondri]|uniref:Inositol 2-dehydrogenase/D-chiro-inositol 3-dehydrogenase n=1 Tax=Alienimonas chondri TaxID=2681879 RepID=A0ABX1VD39_9PLAN|nr:Gfo/Idh/MocA family oxidoreductase [Alienimonas chondri]NNJ24961.1 Inositol 2-dehydrogenase/D-chiro-inositol 3-dehydrogenase [Alienimonas chondri]
MPAAPNRRSFLGAAAATAVAGPLVCRQFAFGRPSAADKINVAVIGLGNQGFLDTKTFLANPACRVVGVCDVNRGSGGYRDESQFCGREPGKKLVDDFYGESGDGCFMESDWRKVVGRDGVDAVVIVVPDHHHERLAIAALEAGQDVYCEKPLSWSVAEGRRMADAAARTGRVAQTGSHHRSDANAVRLVDFVRAGGVGDIKRITTFIAPNNKVGPGPGWQPQPVPEGFDYAAWLGPAPKTPYHPDRCFYRFRFITDYSGGQITNFGAHSNDLAGWCMPEARPAAVTALAATWPAPGSLFSTAEVSKYRLDFTNGVPVTCQTDERSFGLRVEGTKGWVEHTSRKHSASSPALERELTDFVPAIGASVAHPSLTDPKGSSRLNNHVADFLRCVKTRETPVAPLSQGHYTAKLCHLGSLTLGLKDGYGETFAWDDAAERFTDGPNAELLDEANRRLDPRGA